MKPVLDGEVVRWSADPNAPQGMSELIRAANAADVGPSAAKLASMKAAAAAPVKAAALISVKSVIAVVLAIGAGVAVYSQSPPGTTMSPLPPPPEPQEAPQAAQPATPPPPVAQATPAPPVTPAATAVEPPAPAPAEPTAKPTPRTAHVASPPEPPAPPIASPPPPPSEVSLLEQARVALRSGDSTHALELASQHATLYPDGALAEEREAIAIETLVKLGRRDDANSRWSRFASSYPHSNYRSRLQRLIENPR